MAAPRHHGNGVVAVVRRHRDAHRSHTRAPPNRSESTSPPTTSPTQPGARCTASREYRRCTTRWRDRRSSRTTSRSSARRGRRDSSTSDWRTKTLRALIAMLSIALVAVAGCSAPDRQPHPYGAATAKIGESVAILGWNMSVSNLRWESGHVLVDVDAAPSEPGQAARQAGGYPVRTVRRSRPPDRGRRPGSCSGVASLAISPLSAPNPDRLTGTVCLGPQDERSAVRGVYVYSPRDRMPSTTAAYPVAFPVGLLPTNRHRHRHHREIDQRRGVAGRRHDADPDVASVIPRSSPATATCCWAWTSRRSRQQYSDESAQRGGPLMVVVTPTLPRGRGSATPARRTGRRCCVLPDAKLDAVQLNASLCTQGEINEAVLYATLSVVGTHAAVWISRE